MKRSSVPPERPPKKSNLEKTPHQKNEEKLRDDVVEVQLYESSFQLRRTDGTVIFPPVTIEEIVRRAARVKGDARRVRVRVFIRPNAIMSRKIALREALEKSGLTGGDIVMKNLDY